MNVCSICARSVKAMGLCEMHYARMRRNGGPLIKRRRRGVMDAPVSRQVMSRLGPVQAAVLVALVKASGPVPCAVLQRAAGVRGPKSIHAVVHSLRLRFGDDLIETRCGAGYASGERLRRCLALVMDDPRSNLDNCAGVIR